MIWYLAFLSQESCKHSAMQGQHPEVRKALRLTLYVALDELVLLCSEVGLPRE